jgi:hypothetical protein
LLAFGEAVGVLEENAGSSDYNLRKHDLRGENSSRHRIGENAEMNLVTVLDIPEQR